MRLGQPECLIHGCQMPDVVSDVRKPGRVLAQPGGQVSYSGWLWRHPARLWLPLARLLVDAWLSHAIRWIASSSCWMGDGRCVQDRLTGTVSVCASRVGKTKTPASAPAGVRSGGDDARDGSQVFSRGASTGKNEGGFSGRGGGEVEGSRHGASIASKRILKERVANGLVGSAQPPRWPVVCLRQRRCGACGAGARQLGKTPCMPERRPAGHAYRQLGTVA